MSDSEKLDLILSDMQVMKSDMQGMKNEIHDMKDDMQGMKNEIRDMKDDMQGMKNEIRDMKDDMQDMKNEIHDMKDDMQEVKQKVSKVDLTMENEIRVNIQRVAEGHLDLSRNLHEAMRPSNEVEMLAIKVRMLETDVKELKEKIS
ncbi:MAG: hypothetical protein HDR22_05255 [Lachnospiraceae bacterium]|nr:hypothetical protein [Lachnospiraceae bacterium]